MMNFLLFNFILLVSGLAAVFVFSFGLLICYAPLALLLKVNTNPPKVLLYPVLFIAFAYQVYFWGLWSAFCVAVTYSFTDKPSVTWDWAYYISGLGECTSLIGWMSLKEQQSRNSFEEIIDIRKGTSVYSLIAIIAYILFSICPSMILPPYGWALTLTGFPKEQKQMFQLHKSSVLIRGERDAFVDSIVALNKARDLSNKGLSIPRELPNHVENEIIALTEKGINLSNQVSEEFLNYLHPELSVMYRAKLIKGSKLWLEGIKHAKSREEGSEGVSEQLKGNMLIIEWIDWFSENGKSIEGKIF